MSLGRVGGPGCASTSGRAACELLQPLIDPPKLPTAAHSGKACPDFVVISGDSFCSMFLFGQAVVYISEGTRSSVLLHLIYDDECQGADSKVKNTITYNSLCSHISCLWIKRSACSEAIIFPLIS